MTRVLSALVCTVIAVALPATATAGPYEGKSPVKVDLPVRNATIGPNGLAVPPPRRAARGRPRSSGPATHRDEAVQVRRRPRHLAATAATTARAP